MPQTPRGASASTACRTTLATPVDSKLKSTPAPVIRITASTGFSFAALTVCVAPSSFASVSRDSAVSTPTIVVAPTTRAAMMALKPTEPVPKTASEAPTPTLSALMTAPAPV